MANLQRILKRQPVVDEAEFEAVRSRVLVRLAAMNRMAGEAGEGGSRPDGAVEGSTSVGVPVMAESASSRPIVPVITPPTADPVPTSGPLDDGVAATNQGGRRQLVSFARPANITVHARVSGPAPARARASPARESVRGNGTRKSVAATKKPRQPPDSEPASLAAVPRTAAAVAPAPVAKDRPARSRRRTRAASVAVPVSGLPALDAIDPSGQAVLFAADGEPARPSGPSVEDRSARMLGAPPGPIESSSGPTESVNLAGPPAKPPAEADPPPTPVEAQAEPSAKAPAGRPRPIRAAASRPSPPAPRRSPGEPRPVAATAPPHRDPVDIAAYCPSCAAPLDPPPDASRRCLQCHQKIVVRRVGPRTVYLVEAALPVFEAERRRAAEGERWRHERERWLDLALKAGAPADRVSRASREPLSEAAAAAARTLYLSTVDRAFRAAKGERRWEDAAQIRIDQALVLYRIAGAPSTAPDEVVRYHREGHGAMLNGIGEVARDAELRSAGCCKRCRADHGSIVRIAEELRTPRLPHPDCPKGLCRCRWTMSARDQEFLAEFLRRQARLNPRQRPSSAED